MGSLLEAEASIVTAGGPRVAKAGEADHRQGVTQHLGGRGRAGGKTASKKGGGRA